MEIVRDDAQLARYISSAVQVSGDDPVLLDSYLSNATEVDVDAICDGTPRPRRRRDGAHRGGRAFIPGDSACSLPPYSLAPEIVAELEAQTRTMALALGVVGLMNVQFAIQDGDIYVLEVNPRASAPCPSSPRPPTAPSPPSPPASWPASRCRTSRCARPTPMAPAPTTRCPYADPMTLADPQTPWFSVKEAVMPFNRFPGVDTLLGPEMRSTGEVMGWDRTFPRAFLKAQIGAGTALPASAPSSSRSRTATRPSLLLEAARLMHALGFHLLATAGTAAFLTDPRHPRHPRQQGLRGPPPHRRPA